MAETLKAKQKRKALAGYLFEHHNEDEIYAKHKDFLTENGYFEEYDANINQIHEDVRKEMYDFDEASKSEKMPRTGIKATKEFKL